MMSEDELRRILDEVIREGVNGVTPLTGPAFGTTFHIYPVPGGDEIDVRVRIKQKHLPRLLSGLTLEDVERAVEEVRKEVASWPIALLRWGGNEALEMLSVRLGLSPLETADRGRGESETGEGGR